MKRIETFLVYFVILWLVAGAVIQVRHVYAGMMGDLPRAQHAVYYAEPQTFSVWSEKGKLSLFIGVKDVSFGTKDGTAALSFTDQGARKFLFLKTGEGVIITVDQMFPGGPKLPQAPSQPRVGPRK